MVSFDSKISLSLDTSRLSILSKSVKVLSTKQLKLNNALLNWLRRFVVED